jgi:hypothetical protein
VKRCSGYTGKYKTNEVGPYTYQVKGWIIPRRSTQGNVTWFLFGRQGSSTNRAFAAPEWMVTKLFQATHEAVRHVWIAPFKHCTKADTLSYKDIMFRSQLSVFQLEKKGKVSESARFWQQKVNIFYRKINSWIGSVIFYIDHFYHYILKAQFFTCKEKPLALRLLWISACDSRLKPAMRGSIRRIGADNMWRNGGLYHV